MIYVASPYSDPDFFVKQERYHAVCRYCAVLTLCREHCFSPIAHWHPIALKYKLPSDANYWSAYNREMMGFCSVMHVLKLSGWEESLGVQQEIEYYKSVGKTIVFAEPIG